MRYTEEKIDKLEPMEVFVFGSNEAGIHGAGAARKAMDFGAVMSKGIGFKGRTYAIPTKDYNIQQLDLKKIKWYVDRFIQFASTNEQYTFLVTKIGCGLAGYTCEDIAPLFSDALMYDNIVLPKEFHEIINN